VKVRQRPAGWASRFRLWNRVLAVVVVPTVSGVAINQILNNGVVSVPWAVAALGVGAAAFLVEQQTAEEPPVAAGLTTVLDELASKALSEWVRELDDDLLAVRWRRSERNVGDHWDAVFPGFDAAGPPSLEGELPRIAEFYERLPTRRLVVLGGEGMGKSVLARQLAARLLERRDPGDPVPVVLRIGGWDPSSVGLLEWMAAEVCAQFPALAVLLPDGTTRAVRLFTDELLVPLLDGFDELPAASRRIALRPVKRAIPGPLVLISRGTEYEQAVWESGEILTRAAVVELAPPSRRDLQNYLRLQTPPFRADLWRPVFDRLGERPEGPLAITLAKPLMAWLAVQTYAQGTANPVELLGIDDPDALQRSLLDRLIPACYDRDHIPDGSTQPPSVRARHTLSFLAGWVRSAPFEIAWWRLDQAVPVAIQAFVGATVFGLLVAAAVAVPSALAYSVRIGLLWALVAFAASAAPVLILLLFGPRPADTAPPTVHLFPARGRRAAQGGDFARRLAEGFVIGILTGIGAGVIVAAAVFLLRGAAAALASGVTIALVIAPAIVLSRALDAWLSRPVDIMTAAAPGDLLRSARLSAMAQATVAALAFGTAFAVTRGALPAIAAATAAALTRLLVGGLDQRLSRVRLTTWSQYQLAHLWLALRGHLPWRTMSFLEDAHQRGILRRTGPTYHFRHGLLADHLRAAGMASSPPRSPAM
jgi:NACHT domain